MPDGSSSKCLLCPQEFTFFERRHHCRHCNRLVCGDCSTARRILPPAFGHGSELVRVCKQCTVVLSAKQKTKPLPAPKSDQKPYDEKDELLKRAKSFSMAHAKEAYDKVSKLLNKK